MITCGCRVCVLELAYLFVALELLEYVTKELGKDAGILQQVRRAQEERSQLSGAHKSQGAPVGRLSPRRGGSGVVWWG